MVQPNDTTEEWRIIPRYEGFYSASSYGRIRRENTRTSGVAGRVLSASPSSTGYRTVRLYKNGKAETWKVAQLVMAAFVGWPQEGEEVNHKDTDILNDFYSNLEYRTHQGNIDHAVENGVMPFGKAHHHQGFRPKLGDREVQRVHLLLAAGQSTRQVAREFCVSRLTIMRIKRGMSKCYLTESPES